MKRLISIISAVVLAVSLLTIPNDVFAAEQWVYQPGYNEFKVDTEAYLNTNFTPSYKWNSDTIEVIWYTNYKDIIEIESSPYSPQCIASFKKAGYGELVLSVKYWYDYTYYLPNASGLGIGTWHSERMQGVNVIIYRITVKDPLPQNNTKDFAGGSGTESDPYLISTAQQLRNIELEVPYMSAHYKLINDIVFSDADFEEGGKYYNGIGWFPIGTLHFLNNQRPFEGVFDGGGYTISRLETYLNYNRLPVGLFSVNAGTIKNLGIVDSSFSSFSQAPLSGYNPVGCFAGINIGNISNCYSRGNKIAGDVTGGIAGVLQQGGTITDCYTFDNGFTSTPDSKWPSGSPAGGLAGGIVGSHNGGIIDKVYSANYIWSLSFDGQAYYPAVMGAVAGAADDYYGDAVSITNAYYSPMISSGVGYDWTENKSSVINTEKIEFGEMQSLANFKGLSPSVWYVNPSGDYKYPQLYNSKNLQRALFVSSKPAKDTYLKGEPLNLSGASLTEVFTNGSSEVFSITDKDIIYSAPGGIAEKETVYVEGFDSQKTGMQVLTVYYRDLTAYFEVYVYEGTLTNKVSTPIASQPSGFVTSGKSITLETAEDDTFIFYTVDGTTPNTNSTVYTGSIEITKDIVIHAIAAKGDYELSDILTVTYRIVPDMPFAAMIVSDSLKNTNENVTGSVTAQVNNNNGKIYDSAVVILSIRDAKGKLVYIERQNMTLEVELNDIKFDEISITDASSEKYTAYLFVWDSIDSMKPLADSDYRIILEGRK